MEREVGVADLTDALLEQVRDARAGGRRLAICGNASKPWMGRRDPGEKLSLAKHCGIINYDPTELVVTVRAGTPLTELEQVLAKRGQMLAMEAPNFRGDSTIGGVVALGWAGSRSVFAGGVRDAVLGLRMINGLGEELRFGGQVMKNVAGFDVSRLMVGSLGMLGAILELSLKVIPRAQQEISLQWSLTDLAASQASVAGWLQQGYPLSGACYAAGLLKARFSGPGALMREILGQTGGEMIDDIYWRDLQGLELPLFKHGGDEDKLYDCNGEICWSAHTRQRGAGEIVKLNEGSQVMRSIDGFGKLQGRVMEAFDPGALFRPDEAA